MRLEVESLSKTYRLHRERYYTLGDALSQFQFPPKTRQQANDKTLEALSQVSFQVELGEVVGIIGRNGAGKSTLLKILSRITEPTSGRARVRGRVASLLEVGTGFHAELTGRENVYLNGAILGMRRQEIRQRFDEIVAFAGVEKLIDTPVKRYSSGLFLRLAFSVAAHLEPEILIVDEVLAVGDAAFQAKCLGRLGKAAGEGKTVLFVSHNMPSVRALCTRSLWLHEGRLRFDGSPGEAIDRYLQAHVAPSEGVDLQGHVSRNSMDGGRYLRRLTLLNAAGEPTSTIPCGERATFRVDLSLSEPLEHPRGMLWIKNHAGMNVVTLDSALQPRGLPSLRGDCSFNCSVPEISLAPGRYTASVAFGDTTRFREHVDEALAFEVAPADFYGVGRLPTFECAVLMRSEWQGSRNLSPGTSTTEPPIQ
ncbi:MAG: ABC transporter ATP-binding protein [Actinomycetota bacterium]